MKKIISGAHNAPILPIIPKDNFTVLMLPVGFASKADSIPGKDLNREYKIELTSKDRQLISLAQSTLTGYAYIASLIPEADTEECRIRLRHLESEAFRCAERVEFENYD